MLEGTHDSIKVVSDEQAAAFLCKSELIILQLCDTTVEGNDETAHKRFSYDPDECFDILKNFRVHGAQHQKA
jgi:hypothetical protein